MRKMLLKGVLLFVCQTEWRLIRPDGIGVHMIISNNRWKSEKTGVVSHLQCDF